MPAPGRTTLADIVDAGRELLEAGGPPGLTMQAVAARVGVRAPSLYKRVRDRDALLQLVATATADDLADRVEAADDTVAGLARTFRAFAHDRPEGFRLLLSAGPVADPASLTRASAPVLRVAGGLAGPDHTLEAARLVTAWVTGFVTMELAGAFRFEGDLDRAFEFGLERLTAALSQVGPGAGPPG